MMGTYESSNHFRGFKPIQDVNAIPARSPCQRTYQGQTSQDKHQKLYLANRGSFPPTFLKKRKKSRPAEEKALDIVPHYGIILYKSFNERCNRSGHI